MQPVDEKEYQYLLHLFDTPTTRDVYEFLSHSEMFSEKHQLLKNLCSLFLLVDPAVYKKYQGYVRQFENTISQKYTQLTKLKVSEFNTLVDLEKFQIINNQYTSVVTPWEEINAGQDHLLGLLRTANVEVDFQNIGNAARTLLQKLASIVFDPARHTAPAEINVSSGSYKNRLHTFIRNELSGSKNDEFRNYALSLIESTEKGVDLANKLTHDLKADKLLAEACVVGTITTISVVKIVIAFSNK